MPQVLERQRNLAAVAAPEDAFVSALPPNVHKRLFEDLPPPEPPKMPYTSYSTYSYTTGSAPLAEEAGAAPEAESRPPEGLINWDLLLCGFANTEISDIHH